jgi:hypothetical protein
MKGIYEIRNVVTGDTYLGSSQSVQRRWQVHVDALNGGRHPNSLLQAAWLEYGPSAFAFRVLEVPGDGVDLIAREMALIGQLAPSYNIAGTPRVEFVAHGPSQRRRAPTPRFGETFRDVTVDLDAAAMGLVRCPACGVMCLVTPCDDSYRLEHASASRIKLRLIALCLAGCFDGLIDAAVACEREQAESDTPSDATPVSEVEGPDRCQ